MKSPIPAVAWVALLPLLAAAQTPAREEGGIVVVTGGRPSSLPTAIAATVESVDGATVETSINATDAEDALKYLPSLLVRKRYPGDYNHAVLSTRASGTGNSARSLVYADGILLSNLLGNGATFTPRWGLVTPEEIDHVDVLYGPFSAAYPGNSVGAVVDYVTRMPERFEAHAKVGAFVQPFELYGADGRYDGRRANVSLGDRAGGLAWWLNLDRVDAESQPLTFVLSAAPVAGAVETRDRNGRPAWVTGSGSQVRTQQDHAKLKLALDLGDAARASYTLGHWRNHARGNGRNLLTGVASPQTRDTLAHTMHGVSVQSRGQRTFDWTLAASVYDYGTDLQRSVGARPPGGRLTDLGGTGWSTLALRGVWRPDAAHRVDLGVQQDTFRWRQAIHDVADWQRGAAGTPPATFTGNTRLQSLYAQDAWTFAPAWKAVLGARIERWRAWNGAKTSGNAAPVRFEDRSEHHVSPKAALGWQAGEAWRLKLALGRAVRLPTVGELFQGNGGADPVTNPGLKPEKSWTTELSSEWTFGAQKLRTTLFHETTRDALYAQAVPGTLPIVSSTQNVDRLRTVGVELAFEAADLFAVPGLDVIASVTGTDSTIRANRAYVSTPGDTVGKQQPRVPRWRASLLATWRASDALTASFGARHGGRQFGTLNNSDTNGFAYQGFSTLFSTDLRLHYRINRQWSAAVGIDNLNNATYWNFHPYPQRTYSAELRWSL